VSEKLHGGVSREGRIIDTGDECAQRRIVIYGTQPLRNLNKFLNLSGTILGPIMAKDE